MSDVILSSGDMDTALTIIFDILEEKYKDSDEDVSEIFNTLIENTPSIQIAIQNLLKVMYGVVSTDVDKELLDVVFNQEDVNDNIRKILLEPAANE